MKPPLDLTQFDGMTPGEWSLHEDVSGTAFIFCNPKSGRALYIENEMERKANRRAAEVVPDLIAELKAAREALDDCDRAFASWQVGQIPGRPEDILALIQKVRALLPETKSTP